MAAWDALKRFLPRSNKAPKGDYPPSRTMMSSSIRPQSTTLIMRGHTTGSMTVTKVKELIFDRLCKECRAHGAGTWLERDALRQELGVPEDLFHWALTELTSGEGGLFIDRDYTGKRLTLGMRGQLRCKEGLNPFASPSAEEKGEGG